MHMPDYKTADQPVDEKLYHREKFDNLLTRIPEYHRKELKMMARNADDRLLFMVDGLELVLHELKWLDENDIEDILQSSKKEPMRGKHGRG